MPKKRSVKRLPVTQPSDPSYNTHIENCRNAPRRLSNTSGFTGVSFHKAVKKWQARVNVDGKRICLGFFTTKEDAASACGAVTGEPKPRIKLTPDQILEANRKSQGRPHLLGLPRQKGGTKRTTASDAQYAYHVLNYAVRKGKFPKVKGGNLRCVDCGGIASHYDHYKGYAKEHIFTVDPVCPSCHMKRSWKRGEQKMTPRMLERSIKLGKSFLGKKLSAEHRQKISEGLLKLGPEQGRKISLGLLRAYRLGKR